MGASGGVLVGMRKRWILVVVVVVVVLFCFVLFLKNPVSEPIANLRESPGKAVGN